METENPLCSIIKTVTLRYRRRDRSGRFWSARNSSYCYGSRL